MLKNAIRITVKAQLQNAFQSMMPMTVDTESHLADALRDTLQRPGSMVRAELAYRIGSAYNVAENRSVGLAIALEYFHTASLLFDDLPCMDDAKMRRGVRCAHVVYGESTAILAALGLINRAYGLVWKSAIGLDAATQIRAHEYLERQLGVAGLLNGQSQDLHYSRFKPNSTTPQSVAMGKTVSLIRLPLLLPAILGGASENELRQLERLAIFWGLSYQSLDDLKDVLYSEGGAGKTSARDAQLNRPNLALSIGIDEAFDRIQRLMRLADRAVTRLKRENFGLAFLEQVHLSFDQELATLENARLAYAS
jgi:geranylgeranyl diphosphate synthase type II